MLFRSRVEPTADVISKLLSDFRRQRSCKGVIKIDVEGFEKTIISGLIEAIQPEDDVFIIFENNQAGLDFSDLLSRTTERAGLFRLDIRVPYSREAPRWLNSLVALLKGGFEDRLTGSNAILSVGTYVLHLSVQGPDSVPL